MERETDAPIIGACPLRDEAAVAELVCDEPYVPYCPACGVSLHVDSVEYTVDGKLRVTNVRHPLHDTLIAPGQSAGAFLAACRRVRRSARTAH